MKVVVTTSYPYKEGNITRYSNNHIRVSVKGLIRWFYDFSNNEKDIRAKRLITKLMKESI